MQKNRDYCLGLSLDLALESQPLFRSIAMEKDINFRKLLLLFEGKKYVPIVSFAITAIAYAFCQNSEIYVDEIWMLWNLFFNLSRALQTRFVEIHFKDENSNLRKLTAHETLFTFLSAMVGFSWGGVPYIFTGTVNESMNLALNILAFGILTGGVFAQFSSKKCAYTFSIVTILTFMSYHVVHPSLGSLLILPSGILFYYFIHRSVSYANSSIDIYLKFNQQKDLYIKELSKSISLEKHLRIEREATAKNMKMISLGEAAGKLSHEINNPLAIIKGYAELVLAETNKQDSANLEIIKTSNAKILKTVERINRVVKSMLKISRSEKKVLCYFKLNEVLEDILSLYSEKLRTHDIAIEIDIPLEASVIYADVIQFSQIVVNLITNAVDAMVESQMGSKIYIHSKNHDKDLFFYVENDGPSIPENVREKIFETYFTTKEAGKGTGLGLSISKDIAQSMNANLYLDTGEKTCFVLKFSKSQWPQQEAA